MPTPSTKSHAIYAKRRQILLTMRNLPPLLALLLFPLGTSAWIPISITKPVPPPSSSRLFGVDTISLDRLVDHEADGSLMAESIVRWLDAEWIPQEVHVKMADSAKKSYITMRESGKDDLMDIMMQIANDLDSNWQEYDKDAFVNAWDVGNYCADYLTEKSGNEGCECSSQIF